MTPQAKTAIVTGAGSGIGKAIAERLASDGARIVVADVAGAHATAASLKERGHEALALEVDVSNEQDVQQMVEAALGAFASIDILINNAAISTSLRSTHFENLTVDEWQRVMNVNAMGVFLCCRAVSATMRAQGSGRIVNLASGAAFKGSPGMLHYVASKGALISMTRALSRELGHANVTVNAVSPGFTLSEGALRNPDSKTIHASAAVEARALKRDAYAEDIVGAVAFLVGPDSAFITGQIVSVDGGVVYH